MVIKIGINIDKYLSTILFALKAREVTMKSHIFALTAFLLLIFYVDMVNAKPFSSCPHIGYLFHQSENVTLINVDGRTNHQGSITGTYDAVGFNDTDNYIYGLQNNNVVRIHNTFASEEIEIANLPEHNFTAGDVHNDQLYLYAKSEGIWAVDLATKTAAQILKAEHASYNLSDLAIHPTGTLYALGNSKNIHRFDLSGTLEENHLALSVSSGLKGVRDFSSQFFDADGMFFVIDSLSGEALFFHSLSPSSSMEDVSYSALSNFENVANTSDIARCNQAPLTLKGYDFGDAPNSYGTSLLSNGARHRVSSRLFLGLEPDADLLAQHFPLFDDNETGNDDQGITFTTATLSQGSTAFLNATVGGFANGHLSGWVDWNNDGYFDSGDEKVLDNIPLNEGSHTLTIDVPMDASISDAIWSRFRINEQLNISPTGEGGIGEVEDYPLSVTGFDTQESYVWFPSQGGFATLAFEDRWPFQDDYDFNDVVLKYRVGHIQETMTGKLSKLTIDIELQSYGGGYNNGFGIKLDGIPSSRIDTANSFIIINNKHHDGVLEMPVDPEDDAVLIFTSSLKQYFSSDCDNGFLRVDPNCELDMNERVTASMKVSFNTPIAYPEHLHPYLNPFIFAAPNDNHGFDSPPSRGLEIHLKNFSPTIKADQNLFTSEHDRSSNPSINCGVENSCESYQNENGIPFAILVPSNWKSPIEGKSILSAYPGIEDYISNDEEVDKVWFSQPDASKVYSLTDEE